MELYGADFALIQAYFPERSRKQIRRKFQELEQRYCRRIERNQLRREEERRKDYFDQEVLENNLIKWPKKPNIAESSSSEDSLWRTALAPIILAITRMFQNCKNACPVEKT